LEYHPAASFLICAIRRSERFLFLACGVRRRNALDAMGIAHLSLEIAGVLCEFSDGKEPT
jgi:hypothetical protein